MAIDTEYLQQTRGELDRQISRISRLVRSGSLDPWHAERAQILLGQARSKITSALTLINPNFRDEV